MKQEFTSIIFSEKKNGKKEQYTGVSNKDGRTKTWMTNDENGCVLLFEGMHFEIL